MPVSYQFEPEKHLIRTRCYGLVTVQEVVDHFEVLERDEARPAKLDVFLDLSEAQTLPVTHELWQVVTAMRRVRKNVSFGACAILVNSTALYGMMRMFETFTEGLFGTVRTFRNRRDAETWLEKEISSSSRAS